MNPLLIVYVHAEFSEPAINKLWNVIWQEVHYLLPDCFELYMKTKINTFIMKMYNKTQENTRNTHSYSLKLSQDNIDHIRDGYWLLLIKSAYIMTRSCITTYLHRPSMVPVEAAAKWSEVKSN